MLRISTFYLGLGSNLGDRKTNICKAMAMLDEKVRIELVSSLYETEPWGYADQPMFLNVVCRATGGLGPRDLLALAKDIEKRLGREPSFRNAPRLIDIDILVYDNMIIDEPDLVVPHPRLAERGFALIPLAEIAPELVHPKEGKTMKELASQATGGQVRPLVDPDPHPCKACRPDAQVNIRALTMADYEQAWQLWHVCKMPIGESYSRAAVERMTAHDPDLSLVAELHGVIIGAVIGFLHGGHGRVCNHAVDPRCRGRGIGSMLYKEIEGKLIAKGANEIEVMIPVGSIDGRKFFEDMGFLDDDRYAFMVKQYPEGRHRPNV